MRYEGLGHGHPLSDDARRQAHQRAVTPDMIDLVLDLSRWFYDHEGMMTA